MNETTSGGSKSGGRGRLIRTSILLLLLVAVCGAAAYQLKVSQPAYQRACEKILEVRADASYALEGGLKSETVQEVMGFAPRTEDHDNGIRMEYYRWFSLNFKDPCVIAVPYEKNEAGEYVVCETPFLEQPTDEQIVALTAHQGEGEADYGDGGGGEGGGGEDGGGEGGRRRSPDEMFGQLDTDGDQKLSKEELSESRFAERLMESDTDADGFISLEELTARMAQFGGRGDRSGGAERPQRPGAAEDESESASNDASEDGSDEEQGGSEEGTTIGLPGLKSIIAGLDQDGDGQLSAEEIEAFPFPSRLTDADSNKDGIVTLEELKERADKLRLTGTPQKTWETRPYDPRDDEETGDDN